MPANPMVTHIQLLSDIGPNGKSWKNENCRENRAYVTVPPALVAFAPPSVTWSDTGVAQGTMMVPPDSPPPESVEVKVVGAIPGGVPPDRAITGAMGLAEGVVVVMPEGVTELLG
jgi:hypothetical protein